MLTGITLENFKAFKAPQYIPIRPITLVFGPNSAGKSSIIHALAFLRHVHRTNGNCNPGRMRFGWSDLELGPWQNLVFGHDKKASMKIKLHNETASIQWSFENTSSGPRVTTFLIEENGVATARGKNVGIDGIKWEVELHSSHWLWGEFKAGLWRKITGRKFERTQTLEEQAETLSRRRTDEASHDLEGAPVTDCGTNQQDVFEKHFNLWLGDSWRVPPIDCQPDFGSSKAFEGLFPRRAFSKWTFNEPGEWTELRREGCNYSLESESDDIPF